MFLSDEVICPGCEKVFCCIKCRQKHEKEAQCEPQLKDVQKKQELSCPICCIKPLVLTSEIPLSLIQHLAEHLPLQCKRCLKIYETKSSLLEFSVCHTNRQSCKLLMSGEKMEIPKINLQRKCCSTQTSPVVNSCSINNNYGTQQNPLDEINPKWQNKQKNLQSSVEGTSSDALHLQKNNGKGALVRSTSTPTQLLLSKPKESHFDASSIHLSSIHGSSSESECSPVIMLSTQPSPTRGSINFSKSANKVRKGGKGKLAMASPLRQVMSKSIQRAIAQRNANELVNNVGTSNSIQSLKALDTVSIEAPLDLRTTPALRRTRSETIERSSYEKLNVSESSRTKELLFSSHKLTKTQSILVKSESCQQLDTVYQTCSSIEVFTTAINQLSLTGNSGSEAESHFLVTPKTSGAPLKKSLSLENWEIPEYSLPSPTNDFYFTPIATPLKATNRRNYYGENKEQKDRDEPKKVSKPGGGLWSLVTSVIRLPSFGSGIKKPEPKPEQSISLIRRCASFAGVASNGAGGSEESIFKRKRAVTSDVPMSNNLFESEAAPKRIKKIEARKPIERMRKMP